MNWALKLVLHLVITIAQHEYVQRFWSCQNIDCEYFCEDLYLWSLQRCRDQVIPGKLKNVLVNMCLQSVRLIWRAGYPGDLQLKEIMKLFRSYPLRMKYVWNPFLNIPLFQPVGGGILPFKAVLLPSTNRFQTFWLFIFVFETCPNQKLSSKLVRKATNLHRMLDTICSRTCIYVKCFGVKNILLVILFIKTLKFSKIVCWCLHFSRYTKLW